MQTCLPQAGTGRQIESGFYAAKIKIFPIVTTLFFRRPPVVKKSLECHGKSDKKPCLTPLEGAFW
jgi:hypothetical protein